MEYITARIPLLASELIAQLRAKNIELGNVSPNDLEIILHDYNLTLKKRPLELPFIRPDFEGIKQSLQSDLYQKDAWQELIQAGVGSTLLEWVASIGSYSQLSIQRALQEAFLPTAKLQSSVYTSARHLGVHIIRKRPAQVQVELVNSKKSNLIVPSLSQFTIDQIPFFNKTAITFTTDTDRVVTTLYQGEIRIDEYTATGQPYQQLEIGNQDFSVSDEDIYVFNTKYEQYRRVIDGLWHYAGEQFVFYENSTPNGRVEIKFGNKIFGRVPVKNELLKVVYALTVGSQIASTRIDQRVVLRDLNDVVPDRISALKITNPFERRKIEEQLRADVLGSISGKTITAIDGGSDHLSSDFYKMLAPHIYSAKDRAVTRKDHEAIALTFPNLVDVYFQGQQELNPKDRNFINTVAVTPLMKSGELMTAQEWAEFLRFMEFKGIDRINYYKIDPTPVTVDIKAKIFCERDADIAKVANYIKYRLHEQWSPRLGYLGYSMYKTDLASTLEAKHFSIKVDYGLVDYPDQDMILTKLQYIKIGHINLDIDYSTRTYKTYTVPSS